jgi:hypothetical protein
MFMRKHLFQAGKGYPVSLERFHQALAIMNVRQNELEWFLPDGFPATPPMHK